jgi:hypothetical protein
MFNVTGMEGLFVKPEAGFYTGAMEWVLTHAGEST